MYMQLMEEGPKLEEEKKRKGKNKGSNKKNKKKQEKDTQKNNRWNTGGCPKNRRNIFHNG